MNAVCPECGDVLNAYATRCPCGWVRPSASPTKTERIAPLTAMATGPVDPAAVAQIKAHIRHGLGQGDQRRSLFRPGESLQEFVQAWRESGMSREAFEQARMAANGWTEDDEKRYQQRLRDLQLSYRYQRRAPK